MFGSKKCLVLALAAIQVLSACGGGNTQGEVSSSSQSSASISSEASSSMSSVNSSISSNSSSSSESSMGPIFQPVANNLLDNGDLESGQSPWLGRGAASVVVSSTQSNSGSASLLVTERNAAWHGAAFPITYLTPGNNYNFEVWVRMAANEADAQVKLTIQYEDAGGAQYPNVAQGTAHSNGWTRLRGTYTHSPSGSVSNLQVYVESASTTASFYVDDLSMTGTITQPPMPVTGDITINTSTQYQLIDGFGAALPMWIGSAANSWSLEETRKLVGMADDELGLSIVRTIIRPYQEQWPYHVAALREALSYGSEIKVLASPWTPPAEWKDNNSLIDGGKLRSDYYDDYAYHLNDFVSYMNGQGVNIDVVSIQNEPNWHPSYESCDWTGAELRNFLRDQGSKVQNTKLMIAETIGFQREYTDPALNDAQASAAFDYIGGHLYGPWDGTNHQPRAALSAYPLAAQKGKPVWMTEWNYHVADDNPDGSSNGEIWSDASHLGVWNETLDDVMASVHYSMTANWNAYIWWWGKRFYSFIGEQRNDAHSTANGELLKRGWAFSQFSKYVRPGYVRVAATKGGSVANRSNLLITAYQGDDNKLVLVLVNRENSDLDNVSVGLPVVPKSAAYTYTSRYSARAEREVGLAGQRATISIPARTISTLVVEY